MGSKSTAGQPNIPPHPFSFQDVWWETEGAQSSHSGRKKVTLGAWLPCPQLSTSLIILGMCVVLASQINHSIPQKLLVIKKKTTDFSVSHPSRLPPILL